MARARHVLPKRNVIFVGKFKRSLQERSGLLHAMGYERKLKPSHHTIYIVDGALGPDPSKPTDWRYHGYLIPHISEDDFFRSISTNRAHHVSRSPVNSRASSTRHQLTNQSTPTYKLRVSPSIKSVRSSPKSPYRPPIQRLVPVVLRSSTSPVELQVSVTKQRRSPIDKQKPVNGPLPMRRKAERKIVDPSLQPVVFMGRFNASKQQREDAVKKAHVRIAASVSAKTAAVILGDLTNLDTLSEMSSYENATLHGIRFIREADFMRHGLRANYMYMPRRETLQKKRGK